MCKFKSYLILLFVISIGIGQKCYAQYNYNEWPNYNKVVNSNDLPLYIDFGAKIFKPLHKSLGALEVKQMIGGNEFWYQLDGKKASFRIAKIDSLVFLIKSNTMPKLALYKLHRDGEKSVALGLSQRIGSDIKIVFDKNPDILITPYKDNIYQVTVLALGGLPAGEYCFTNNWNTERKTVNTYRFAID